MGFNCEKFLIIDTKTVELNKIENGSIVKNSMIESSKFIDSKKFNRYNFNNCEINSKIFYRCHFYYCKFRNCLITNCIFINCDNKENKFIDCIMTNCDFQELDTSTTFKDCTFVGNSIIPETGEFIGYKLLKSYNYRKNLVGELIIPADAERVWVLGSRKCRANKVIVKRFLTLSGRKSKVVKATGPCYHSQKIIYRIGETIKCEKPLDTRKTITCSSGIHFFPTFGEAVNFLSHGYNNQQYIDAHKKYTCTQYKN